MSGSAGSASSACCCFLFLMGSVSEPRIISCKFVLDEASCGGGASSPGMSPALRKTPRLVLWFRPPPGGSVVFGRSVPCMW